MLSDLACEKSLLTKHVFVQAKSDYERRKAEKEWSKLRGEDKWMLPELESKLRSSPEPAKKKSKKDKKKKKKKKEKKSKKTKKDDESADDSSNSDEWEEKTAETLKPPINPQQPLQRDDWMTSPSFLPTFSSKDLASKRTSLISKEETDRKIMMEKPGQTSRELNPYWKDGGTGLAPEKPQASAESKKSRFRRPSDDDNESGSSRSMPKFTSSSQPAWKKKANVESSSFHKQVASSSSGSSSSSEEDEKDTGGTEQGRIWSEQELNTLNAKIIKAEIMGQEV